MFHDVWRDAPTGDPHVLVFGGISERRNEVEVAQVDAEELRTWGGDGAVDEELGGG